MRAVVLRRRARQFAHPSPPYRTSAVVEKFDEDNQPAGFGPSDDPSGVFFGVGGIDLGDTWYVCWKSPGVDIIEQPGGIFDKVGVPGSYALEWRRHDFSLNQIFYGRHSFVIPSS